MSGSSASPRVTVAVCVFNGEEFLASSLESALAQTDADFEVVVVDDGSTDGSALVARRFAGPRLRILSQTNQGAAAALGAAVHAARGEYVAFLDQDDLWEPGKLAFHLEHLDRSRQVDLSFSWFRVIDAGGRPLGVYSNRYRGAIDFRGLLTDFVIGATSNVVVRREAISRAGGIDPSFPRLYDLDLFLRIALLAPGNLEAIPSDLVLYRRHDAQMSRGFTGIEAEWERVLRKMQALAPAETAAVEARARSNAARYLARLAYESRRYREALRLLRSGFLHAPGAFLSESRNWLTGAAVLSGLAAPEPIHRRLERWAGLRYR